MLRNVNDLYGFSVAGSDGPIGEVRDCYFDDQAWTVRFFVVETGPWLGGRKVLISAIALHGLHWVDKALSASVTQKQVKNSPDVDTSKPVSRQHEAEQFGYYGYPYYWGEENLWGGGPRPGTSLAGYGNVGLPTEPQASSDFVDAQVKLHRARGDDPHLRSCRAIERYHIHATDGDIGHVESLLVDDEAWAIRYLVVNTSDWWLGHQMLVAPPWIADISWLDATVSVDLTRQAVRDAPTYDPEDLPSPEQEHSLFHHYGRRDHRQAMAMPPPA
ncbi:MAG: PRC-barrel domain-containing protein [Pseudomonadota bacterium]|nr:PRC-barrel domain-containing protein [Pseudomonadota bacterium]